MFKITVSEQIIAVTMMGLEVTLSIPYAMTSGHDQVMVTIP